MEAQVRTLVEMIEALPPELQREVQDWVEILYHRHAQRENALRLDWRGALRDLRDRYTSVELQHQIRDRWSGVSA